MCPGCRIFFYGNCFYCQKILIINCLRGHVSLLIQVVKKVKKEPPKANIYPIINFY